MSAKQKMCTVMDLPTSILASLFAPLSKGEGSPPAPFMVVVVTACQYNYSNLFTNYYLSFLKSPF